MLFQLSFSSLPVSAQTATNEPSALAPPYGVLPPTFWEQHEPAILTGVFALLAFAFFFLRARLRPESKVVLPPEVLARENLTRLLRQPEDGKVLSEVPQILRRYVVAAFGLPAGEMTTAEFCAALAGNGKIGAELARSISDFLRECDERKFSTSPATAPLDAASRALEMVSLAEKARDGQTVCLK